MGKPDAARALWDTAIANGPIDILINNAGSAISIGSTRSTARVQGQHRTRAQGEHRVDLRVRGASRDPRECPRF